MTMSPVIHHIPDETLQAYVTGALPHPYAVVVAAHLSLCDNCRAAAEAQETLGGAMLEAVDPAAIPVDADLRARTLALLDTPMPERPPAPKASGIYPAAIMAELKGRAPRWKNLGAGIRQSILSEDKHGSVRLLYIPGGRAVPDHGHGGLELTLVLQGSFSDHTGTFGPGDVQVAGGELEHQPIADPGPACISLAATDAPLSFNSFFPRLLQPLFRI